MDVLIVSSCTLPVPAVKGGAVPTLIETLIKQNENYKNVNLSVFCLYNELGKEISKQYEKFDEWLYRTYEKEIEGLFE